MTQETILFNNDLEEWRAQRYADLREADGYLSLAGLYWLEDGEHTFGSDSSHSIGFTENPPLHIGSRWCADRVVPPRLLPEAGCAGYG